MNSLRIALYFIAAAAYILVVVVTLGTLWSFLWDPNMLDVVIFVVAGLITAVGGYVLIKSQVVQGALEDFFAQIKK